MLYALTICIALAFAIAGCYALSASGDIRRLPLTRTTIYVIIALYSLRALAGANKLTLKLSSSPASYLLYHKHPPASFFLSTLNIFLLNELVEQFLDGGDADTSNLLHVS